MKWMKAVVWSALLSTAWPAFSRDKAPETPQDYATGMMLEATGSSP